MVERLNNIVYSNTQDLAQNFDPCRISLDIRSREDLAAVNDFLVTLGRDVSAGGYDRHQHLPVTHHTYPSDSYFDPVSLSQLGLDGMPGVPVPVSNYATNGNTFSGQPASRSSHSSIESSQFESLYPSLDNQPVTYSPTHHEYMQSQSDTRSRYAPSNNNNNSGSSNNPSPASYQHSPNDSPSEMMTTTSQFPSPSDATASFDYLRPSRGAAPVPHLAPVDYAGKSMRTIASLKAAPETRNLPHPKLPMTLHRGPPAKLTQLTPSVSTLSSKSLYPLLRSGDIQYKLPPLKKLLGHDSSPPPVNGDPHSTSTESSPAHETVLPSLRSIAPPRSPHAQESDDLALEIDRIGLESRGGRVPAPTPRAHEVSPEMRRKHAKLIRNLLVSINMEFKSRVAGTTV
jgi:hypothetical protein